MVLSILVENTAGVLSRVAGLFARRGYNIDSLTVSETETTGRSRMTIVVSGEDEVLEQIHKQLAKLIEVKEIIELKPGASVCRELILVKVAVDASQRQQVIAEGFEVKELVRTGITGLTRGNFDMLDGELE